MAHLSENSKDHLHTCDADIILVINQALGRMKTIDFAVTCGTRGETEQNEAFRTGKSKVKYPDSKHNYSPSKAVDIVAYVSGKPSWNHKHMTYLAGYIMAVAEEYDIKLRCGCNWDQDDEVLTDQTFQDLGHFELVE